MKRALLLLLGVIGGLLLVVLVVVVVVFVLQPGSRELPARATLAGGEVTSVKAGVSAAHLVDTGDGGAVLIDAGDDPRAEAILAALQASGRAASDIVAVLLTHGHPDHTAGLAALPDAPVYVLGPDADLVRGERTADNLLGRFREARRTGVEVARELSDGEVLAFGPLRVEVFGLPGHTRGSAAFFARGVLFVGDSAAATMDGAVVAAAPVVSADRAQNRRSLRRLCRRLAPRRAEVRAIAFGHHGSVEGLGPLLRWCERHPEPEA